MIVFFADTESVGQHSYEMIPGGGIPAVVVLEPGTPFPADVGTEEVAAP